MGGNAILSSDPSAQAQQEALVETAKHLVKLIKNGDELIITHGNGPQVGNLLLQHLAANSEKNPAFPLDSLVAMTEGSIGYWLQNALQNALLEEGIEKATKEIPIRPNIVDPITRENTNINVGDYIPPIDIELIDEDYLEITILPKGFGSENNNAMKMALPAEGIEGIKDFVVESVLKAKGKPCPPTVIGVGIGGTSDLCLKLGKKALLGEVGKRNPDPEIAKLELEILEEINKSGIGPMGLGGKTTTLDVKILKAHTHTAGLPVGVCVQCWADRHATTKIYDKK